MQCDAGLWIFTRARKRNDAILAEVANPSPDGGGDEISEVKQRSVSLFFRDHVQALQMQKVRSFSYVIAGGSFAGD